jgi:uncharacterized protein YidB (DUF937 family)
MDDLAGILNQVTGAQPDASGGGTATAANPAAAVTGLATAIGEQGGIDPVLDKLRAAGYDQQVDSWISTGDNQTIPPQQLASALGDDTVQKLSSSSGISIQQLLPLLAAFLPMIVNMLTPKGQAPAGGVNEAAKNAGPDLGGLLGGLLGGGGGASGGTPDLGGLLGGLLGGGNKG